MPNSARTTLCVDHATAEAGTVAVVQSHIDASPIALIEIGGVTLQDQDGNPEQFHADLLRLVDDLHDAIRDYRAERAAHGETVAAPAA